MELYSAAGHKSLSAKPKNKKIGKVILAIWIVSLVVFILNLFLASQSGRFLDINGVIFIVTFFAGIILLPIWGFILGNRLVKIITSIPIFLFVLSWAIYLLGYRPHKIVGNSMSPKLINGEYVISEKIPYFFESPKRGDIVIFAPPMRDDWEYIARIVGLPGENISIRNGKVYINNKQLQEPYLANGVVTADADAIGSKNIVIPEKSFAVLGDNRSHASDSRHFGFVKMQEIRGKVFYAYWPTEKSGFIKSI